MLMGPLRLVAYSSPILALPQSELAMVLSVATPLTLNTARICRWSCKLAPTPGRSCTTSMPCWRSSAAGLRLDDELGGLGAGPHLEVGAAVAGGPQEGLGGVPAPAAFLVHLKVAHASVAAAVEVVGGRDARLLRGLGKAIEDIPAQALLFHAPLAGAAGGLVAMQALEVFIHAAGLVQAPVVLVAAEVGQGVVPAPAGVARQFGPLVVVARLAAHVDHAVDAAAAAQRLAARVAQGAAVQARIGFGVVEPVGARVADEVQVAHGDVDPVVVVLAAGLDEEHAVAAVGAQAVAQQGAGGAAADDDGVKRGVVAHGQGRWQCEEGDGGPLCGRRRVCREGQCLLLLNI